MDAEWLDQVTVIIRGSDFVAYPLDRLHGELRTRFSSPIGSVAELRTRLLRRPDRFLVIEPGAEVPGGAGLPPGVRAQLVSRLREAGLLPVAQVLLASPDEPEGEGPEARLSRAVSRSLTMAWAAQGDSRQGRAELLQATQAANELRGVLRRMYAEGGP